MKKKSSLRKFLTNVYGYMFFDSLVFMYPLYTIFFSENGLTDPQISLLFIIWCFAIILCQMPVGVLADKFSRKGIIFFGHLAKIACFFIWIAFPTFWGFALGFLLWGFESAVYNAVYEAVIYDELKARHHQQIYTRVCGNKSAVSNVARLIATTGTLMSPWGYNVITILSGASLSIALFFILNMKIMVKSTRKKTVQFFKMMRLGTRAVIQKPYILYMMLLAVSVVAFSCFEDYFGLIGIEVGIHREYIGLIFFFAIISQIAGQAVAYKFEKIKDFTLYASVILFGLMTAAFGIFYSMPGLVMLIIPYFGFAIIRVLIYSRFQKSIPCVYRTTVLSLYSFCEQSIWAVSYGVVFLGGLMGGWRFSILLLGMCCVLIGFWATIFIPRKKNYRTRGIQSCLPRNKSSV